MIGASNIHFKEEQRLREPWLWIIIGGSAIVSIGGMMLGLVNESQSKTKIITGLAIAIPIQVLVIALLYFAKLEIKVNENGIHYKWSPYHFRFKTILRTEIDNYYVKDTPLLKRGVSWLWGYGWSYNTAGGKGIQFDLKGNRSVFLGSLRIAAFKAAVDQLMQLKNKIQ